MPDLEVKEIPSLRLYYGYEQDSGKFVLLVTDDAVGSPNIYARVSIRRSDTAKIANHMTYGKKGDTRVIQDHDQLIIPQPEVCGRCGLDTKKAT